MIKKVRNSLLVFGLSMAAGISAVHAVPLTIETSNGTCYLEDVSDNYWMYLCDNGVWEYVERNQGGSGGGHNGGADPNECEEYC